MGTINMSRITSTCCGLALIAVLAGCNRGASDAELGEVCHYLPRIDGMEVRYHLPPQMPVKSSRSTETQQVDENSTDQTPSTVAAPSDDAKPADDAAAPAENSTPP